MKNIYKLRVRDNDSLRIGLLVVRIPVGGEIFRTYLDRQWG